MLQGGHSRTNLLLVRNLQHARRAGLDVRMNAVVVDDGTAVDHRRRSAGREVLQYGHGANVIVRVVVVHGGGRWGRNARRMQTHLLLDDLQMRTRPVVAAIAHVVCQVLKQAATTLC